MMEYEPSMYGNRVADVYDRMPQVVARDVDRAVVTLADLAGPGAVLELGIGTGRFALPLAARGLAVHGIDASEAMVKKPARQAGWRPDLGRHRRLRGRRGRWPVSPDFRGVQHFFGLLTQEEQVRCFARVAEHLTAEGVFVLEAFVPDVTRFDRGQRLGVTHMDVDVSVYAYSAAR